MMPTSDRMAAALDALDADLAALRAENEAQAALLAAVTRRLAEQQRLIESNHRAYLSVQGIEPATYMPAPMPPKPVPNSGIGGRRRHWGGCDG